MHVSGTTKNRDEQNQQQHRTVSQSILERKRKTACHHALSFLHSEARRRRSASWIFGGHNSPFPFPFLYSRERIGSLSSPPIISIITQRQHGKRKRRRQNGFGCLFITHFVFLFLFSLRGYDAGIGKRHNNVINAKPEFPFCFVFGGQGQ